MKKETAICKVAGKERYEKITFKNGISEYEYSVTLHMIIHICNEYGLDFSESKDYYKAKEILRKQREGKNFN
jgi:hypothetical protein